MNQIFKKQGKYYPRILNSEIGEIISSGITKTECLEQIKAITSTKAFQSDTCKPSTLAALNAYLKVLGQIERIND